MADSERRQRGVEMMKKVYAGDVVTPPAGAMPFSDLMLEQLFAEVWTRETLAVRDRRLVLLGIIGALGERDTFQIQVKAALKKRRAHAGAGARGGDHARELRRLPARGRAGGRDRADHRRGGEGEKGSMTQRAYDPEFAAMLPMLPTVGDYSSLAKVQALRANRAVLVPPPPDRTDVAKEDREVPGAAGPPVPIRIYRPLRPRGRAAACSRSTAAAS